MSEPTYTPAPICYGCDWELYAALRAETFQPATVADLHAHNDAEDGPRVGCCAHTCGREQEASHAGL